MDDNFNDYFTDDAPEEHVEQRQETEREREEREIKEATIERRGSSFKVVLVLIIAAMALFLGWWIWQYHSDFRFSITNDSLVRKAALYSHDGQRVVLTYKEYKGKVLWRGNTKFVVTDIETDTMLVKPNPYPRETPKK